MRKVGLDQSEVQRLRDAYGSEFYAQLVQARQELQDAIGHLDEAVERYEAIADGDDVA